MRKVSVFLLFLLAAFSTNADPMDSLLQVLKGNIHDTARIQTLLTIGEELYFQNADSSNVVWKQALELCEKNLAKENPPALKKAYVGLIGLTYGNLGYIALNNGDLTLAEKHYKKSLEIAQNAKDEKAVADCYLNIGFLEDKRGNYQAALDAYHHALKILEANNLEFSLGYALSNLGVIYRVLGDNAKALDYYQRSLAIRKKVGDQHGTIQVMNNLGLYYHELNDLSKAKKYYTDALELSKKINDRKNLAISFSNLGNISMDEKNYPEGIRYFKEGLKIGRELVDEEEIVYSMTRLAIIYEKAGENKISKAYCDTALKYAEKLGYPDRLRDLSQILSKNYIALGDYRNGYHFFSQYVMLKDSLSSKENRKAMMKKQMQYEWEKKEAALVAEKEKERAVINAEKKKQRLILYSISGGLAIVLIFSALLLNRFRVTRRQKQIIEEQKSIVETKNKDITDSINYASRIQGAILTPPEEIALRLTDSFVFYRPKDIVSGDFYYYAEMGDSTILAVADCTGHGVPGAFMSLIGNDQLNKIIIENNITTPGIILSRLHDGIRKALKQDNRSSQSTDGMDVALCTLFDKNRRLQYAGALRNLYVLRQSAGLIEEVKADKRSIGGVKSDVTVDFTNHEISLQPGDSFYLFSDGFVDQFGGPDGKKFMTRRFKSVIESIASKPMKTQKILLEAEFDVWKGAGSQVDDVCVIGVRV